MFYSSCPGTKAVKKTLDFWNGLILCSSSMLSRQNIFYLYYYLLIFVNTSLNWAPEPCCVWYCANTPWVAVPAPETFTNQKSQERSRTGAKRSGGSPEVTQAVRGGGKTGAQGSWVTLWPCSPRHAASWPIY